MDFLIQLIEVLVLPCLGLLMLQGVQYLKLKRSQMEEDADNQKYQAYYDSALEAITKSVVMVNQTFVDALKNKGEFDADAQKVAFHKACENALTLMGDEAAAFLENAMKDFDLWLEVQVEASVNEHK